MGRLAIWSPLCELPSCWSQCPDMLEWLLEQKEPGTWLTLLRVHSGTLEQWHFERCLTTGFWDLSEAYLHCTSILFKSSDGSSLWAPGNTIEAFKILLQNMQSMKNASLYCVLAGHLSERGGAYKVYFTMLPQNHFQEDKFPVRPHSNSIPISNFCWDHIFQSLLLGSLGICLQLCLVFHFSAVERNGVG